MEKGVVRLASIYLPNGNPAPGDKYSYKLAFMNRLIAHSRHLLAFEEPLVLAGDFNVIPEPRDAADPAQWTTDALFLPQTRAKFREHLALGFTDALRAATDSAAFIHSGITRRVHGNATMAYASTISCFRRRPPTCCAPQASTSTCARLKSHPIIRPHGWSFEPPEGRNPPLSLRFGAELFASRSSFWAFTRRMIRGRRFGHRRRVAGWESLCERRVEIGVDLVFYRLIPGFPGHCDISCSAFDSEMHLTIQRVWPLRLRNTE